MEKLCNFLHDCWAFTVICFILVSLATPAVMLAATIGVLLWNALLAPVPYVWEIAQCTLIAMCVFMVIDYFIIRWLVKADEEKRATED